MPALLLLAALALAACDSTPALLPPGDARGEGELALTTDRDAYVRGAAIGLRLVNTHAERVTTGVLECASLEAWDGEAWAPARERFGRVCIEIAVVLGPGERLRGAIEPVVAQGGIYRAVHTGWTDDGRAVRGLSPPFQIR
ncbi:MAG: hypothetical protein ACK41D_10460 [Rubricoccaceae bacterium]